MSDQPKTIWVPTDEDRLNLTALRKIIQAETHTTVPWSSVVSLAIRIALDVKYNPEEEDEDALAAREPLTVYTDGACRGNPGPGGWACVFVQNGLIVCEFSGGAHATTNNRMELTAVLEALREAPDGRPLTIITDSKNVIGWLDGGWQRKEPNIAAICAEIDPLLAQRQVTFKWVKGHAGDPMNEFVDQLCVSAIPDPV